MVTVVKRPTGHKIIDQAITATITDSTGDALVNFPSHALTTGAIVYITSDIDEYNGFWYITTSGANAFKISEYATADFVEYYQNATIEYYQTQAHDWSSIFLPIVYKLTNDRWPVNSVDTARTVSSQSDDNSFTNLNLSGVLKSSFNALEFVKISGASDEDLNAVWQIVEVVSTSDITINLPYSASNSFSGATVQYYYNNYQVKVKITAGIDPAHQWASKKPYEEVAQLSLTPDDNNEVMFSVSDYITSKVAIKNNLTLFSLPLNLDAFTQFYISTAESYDDSDNYSLTTFESAFTDDSFEGYAIAGKLPFKNLYSGDYADYVYTTGSPAMWLTLMSRLLAVDGLFFDISFIKNVSGSFSVAIKKYVSDYFITETIDFADQGVGVYRIPLTIDSNYDSFCIQATIAGGDVEVTLDNNDFENSAFGSGTNWTLGANPTVFSTGGSARTLVLTFAFVAGVTYTITATLSIDSVFVGSPSSFIAVGAVNNIGVSQFINSDIVPTLGVSTQAVQVIFTATASCVAVSVDAGVTNVGNPDEADFTLLEVTISSDQLVSSIDLTEEICIDILESCEVQNGFTPDVRLLEDGDFRLLE